MNKKIVLLNSEEHRNLMLVNKADFSHLSGHHMAPLVVGEYMVAANNFPVVFVKDEAGGELRSVGLFGLEAQENLMFNGEAVETTYMPLDMRRYPFYLAGDETGEMKVCIDLASPLLTESEGQRLFEDDGKETEVIERTKGLLLQYLQGEAVTREFLQFISELDLIAEANLTVTIGGEKRGIRGVYKVDEDKLRNLSDEQVLELHKKNYLALIYAHLSSLGQFQKLVKLKHERIAA